MKKYLYAACAALIATVSLGAAPALASTVNEDDYGKDGFSAVATDPTVIAAGTQTILGTGKQNKYDIFAVPASLGQIEITFSAPDKPGNIGFGYSAGGQVLLSDDPFRWNWDGERAANIDLSHATPMQKMVLDIAGLGDADGDGLSYIGLYFTHGKLDYAMSLIPSAAALSARGAGAVGAVPLPPSMALMLAGMAGIGLLSARRGMTAGTA